ncbi:hypothetical protein MBLNU457_g0669t1 [Dothideomycetes sp. NU457]
MPTTTQYVALDYDELSEIQDDIRTIEPRELARLIRLTQFDCKAERVLHGALIRDFIELYLEEQSPQVQRHVLQAVRQLKAGERISSPPPPMEIVVSNEEVVYDDGSETMADCIRVSRHSDNDDNVDEYCENHDDDENDDADVSMTRNKGRRYQTVYYNGHPAALLCTQRPAVNALPEEEIPPWNSPYASSWGFAADDQINAAESGPVESFSDDDDGMDLDSLPGRPWAPDFGPGKDIDGPQRENSTFAPRASSPAPDATPERRSARQTSPIATHDAAATPPQTTVLNGIPTPLTGSFASAANVSEPRHDNEASPTPAGRSTERPQLSPTTETLRGPRDRSSVSAAPEFSPPSSPVRFFSRADSPAIVDLTGDSPAQSPRTSPSREREDESPVPFRRGRQGRRGRSGRETAHNEAEDIRSRSPSAARSHRSNSSQPPRRHLPRRRFPLRRDHNNNSEQNIFNDAPIPFPILNTTDDEELRRAKSYHWRIAATMAEDLHVVSKLIHDLHGFEDRTMTPLRALCERYSELRTEVGELKRKRAEDEEVMRDLVRGRREDAEKIAEMAESVRELKRQFREVAEKRGVRRFRRVVVED